ncbi:MAG TPA: hypothetical protein EYP41_04245 [Anaerolineae bacterium]|nr:hypothetical protein [Anaerolineae bacterium]
MILPLGYAQDDAPPMDKTLIDQNEIERISQELGGFYLETSAKTGFQVESAFHYLANLLLNVS